MKKILLPLLILLLTSSLTITSAQEQIQGTIIDSNGDFLIGANIINWRGNTFISGTGADEKGQFRIKMTKGDSLEITYIGLKSQKLSLEDMLFDNLIILEEKSNDLPQVVVSAQYGLMHQNCKIICCLTSCISDENKLQNSDEVDYDRENWKYYPNPTSGPVTIEINQQLTGWIEVIDNKGVILQSVQIREFPMNIDLSPFVDGIYHLRYMSEDHWGENIGKVVKIR